MTQQEIKQVISRLEAALIRQLEVSEKLTSLKIEEQSVRHEVLAAKNELRALSEQ